MDLKNIEHETILAKPLSLVDGGFALMEASNDLRFSVPSK